MDVEIDTDEGQADESVAGVAGAIADPACARMLCCSDGRPRPH